ncbi:MAG: DNA-directed RNA polymerase subunit K [Candidatus Woesearchaeota archaeon]
MKYTKYEKARIIGARSLQLSMGAPILIDLKSKDIEEMGYSVLKIANKEFDQGLIPITVNRAII